MKNKTKKIILIVLVVVLVLAAGLAGWFWYREKNAEPVYVFPFQYVGMTEYWGDNQESYGPVSTDKIQTVYISDTQEVTEISVAQGDTVKKGDILMTFDTTLSDLAMERERLKVEKLKLQLQQANDRLREINAMKPMVIPKPQETEDENLGTALKDNYLIFANRNNDGSNQNRPVICWIKDGLSLENELLEELRLKAEEFQTINAQEAAKEQETETEEETDGETEPAGSEPAEPTEPIKVDVTKFYVVFKSTRGNMSLGQRLVWNGTVVSRSSGGFVFRFFDASAVTDHQLAAMGQEEKEQPEIDFGSGYTAAQIAEMRSQQEKTIKDLEFKIKMAEADYKIALTEVSDGKVYARIDGEVVSVLTEEEARQTMQPILKVSGGGGFYIEGSVSELEKEKMQVGQEVTVNDWNTGMTHTGRVIYDSVDPKTKYALMPQVICALDRVDIFTWHYDTGVIQALGDFPAAGNGWNGMGNPNASFYPFTVFVDEAADLQEGRYVSVIYSTATGEHGVYLQNPFLRTEQGKTYVYVQGADGKLEQRFVKTGKALWGSYMEILEGLSEEDMVAFPYGKNVKAGAPAVEGDMSDLYG